MTGAHARGTGVGSVAVRGTRNGSVAYVLEDRKKKPGSFETATESLCGGRVLRFCVATRERMQRNWGRDAGDGRMRWASAG